MKQYFMQNKKQNFTISSLKHLLFVATLITTSFCAYSCPSVKCNIEKHWIKRHHAGELCTCRGPAYNRVACELGQPTDVRQGVWEEDCSTIEDSGDKGYFICYDH